MIIRPYLPRPEAIANLRWTRDRLHFDCKYSHLISGNYMKNAGLAVFLPTGW